jgi:uncharacterized protein (TIGR01777 family)
MHIFITGGTGFIGGHLVKSLLRAGHRLTILTRSARQSSLAGVAFLQDDPRQPGPWQEIAAGHDAVINLAGASPFRPWTEKNKHLIRDSRIRATAHIAEALAGGRSGVSVLISASAIGYYGDRGDEELVEPAPPGNDFLARLAADWEQEAEKCSSAGVRVVRCRFGIVFGPDGGALAKMKPIFKLGLGCPLGSGKQWFSWVHIQDLMNILSFLLDNRELSGAVNCTAPKPVTNRELTRELAGALRRPAFLPPVPSFLLKTVLGEGSQIVLDSQRVIPRVLLDHGFTFTFPDLRSALTEIMNQQG